MRTSRGDLAADRTVVCVGHDVDRLFPDIAAAAGVTRCSLQMLRVASPGGARYEPAVLTGTSLLRYGAFASCPSTSAVRARLEREHGQLLEAAVNLMFTQGHDGGLTIGDTHRYDSTADPFGDERLDEMLLAEVRRLLGVERLDVRERWLGVYASASEEFLVATPHAGARVVSVTAGIGMSTAFGLATSVLDDLLAPDEKPRST